MATTVSSPLRHITGMVRSVASAVLILVAAACGGPLTPAEQLTVERYLVCIECPAPLRAVRALGDAKPRATVDSLNVALLLGPGPQQSSESDSLLHLGYTRDSTWRASKAKPALPQRDSVVSTASRGYANGYRARGALGMGWIGSARARRHLDAAITNGQLPPSVLAAARFARDSIPRANRPSPP